MDTCAARLLKNLAQASLRGYALKNLSGTACEFQENTLAALHSKRHSAQISDTFAVVCSIRDGKPDQLT
jgi:hypothetical protein